MKLTQPQRITRAASRLEEAAAELLYQAEQWTVTSLTLYDLKVRRRSLLEAGRRYGRAVDALGRVAR